MKRKKSLTMHLSMSFPFQMVSWAWADQLSGFLHKKCCFVQPGFTWGCRLIYIQGWLGVALSCSAHMRNCFLPSSLGFAGMRREQRGLEMTSVDSEWWLMCLWRVDASLNTVKSRLTWQSQLVCSPNPSAVGIHGNTRSQHMSSCSQPFAQQRTAT